MRTESSQSTVCAYEGKHHGFDIGHGMRQPMRRFLCARMPRTMLNGAAVPTTT